MTNDLDDDFNPYRAPQKGSDADNFNPQDAESARSVFLAWEKLRLVYNGVLFTETMLLGLGRLGRPRFLFTVVECAVVANVCFCAGPCAEGYLNLLGFPRKLGRRIVFGLGMVLAAFVTLGVLASLIFPGMD